MMWRSSYRLPMRSTRSWWNEMRRLNREMDFVFGGTRGPIRSEYPLLNAWAGEDGLVITADIPGIAEDELEITVDGRSLTLAGTRLAEMMPEGARRYRGERASGAFSRVVQLPFDVDVDGIRASYVNGVIEINLPRLPEDKPRRIALNGS